MKSIKKLEFFWFCNNVKIETDGVLKENAIVTKLE